MKLFSFKNWGGVNSFFYGLMGGGPHLRSLNGGLLAST